MSDLPFPLSGPVLREALRASLAARERNAVTGVSAQPSAVLLALFESEDDVYMWLVKRPETMRRHRGQVAFPGGKMDPEDRDLVETALREAEEEIGLGRERVEVLGALDDLVTGTGFIITPQVAWLAAPFEPTPNPTEVSRVFRAPLRTFTTRAAGVFPRIGHTIEGEFVWGATFAIARSLGTIVRETLRVPR
jgi:8-oxo-dGTP pyrophosphatase MutT (NUDIX family)